MRLELCFQHYCKGGSSAWEFRLELQDEASPWVHKKLDNGVSLSLLTIIGQSKKSVKRDLEDIIIRSRRVIILAIRFQIG